MRHRFRALTGFEDRHSADELEACAAALFLAHGDVDHYELLERDLHEEP